MEMLHSFDTGFAEEVGLSAAVVLHHIVEQCKENEAQGKGHYDGRYWMFCTQEMIAKSLPYLSLPTVKRLLVKLSDAGLILVGNYNKLSFDRTCWYSPSDRVLQSYASHAPIPASPQPEPQKADVPPLIPPEEEARIQKPKPKPVPAIDYTLFEKFWLAYPRKDDKGKARTVWARLKVNPELHERIMSALRRAIQFDHRFRDKTYTPYASTWLNGKPWEEEFSFPEAVKPRTPINTPAFEELKRIMAEPGAPPPPLPPELDWRR